MSLWRHSLALVALLAALPARADEDEPAPLAAKLSVDAHLEASFDVTQSFTEAFRRRLVGGMLSRAVFEVALIDGKNRVVATAVRECQLRLDVWEEVLEVLVRDPTRRVRQKLIVVDDGLELCGHVERLVLAEQAPLADRRGYFLRVIVHLNPVSDELIQETREFLSNPRGTRVSRPSSFFDTVASFFSPAGGKVTGETFLFEASDLARPEKEGP